MRAKSLAQTEYLARLARRHRLTAPPLNSPSARRASRRRRRAPAVEHADEPRIAKALKIRGIVPDFRAPNVIRLAPAPLYTTYRELWRTARALREIIDRGEHLRLVEGRNLVA